MNMKITNIVMLDTSERNIRMNGSILSLLRFWRC